jgi:integrase
MPKLAQPKAETVFRNALPKAKAYLIPDGHGLNMVVTPDGSKLWVFRYRVDGKEKKIAIRGGYPTVSVKDARKEADRFRDQLARGEDPGSIRKAGKEEIARKAEEIVKDAAKNATTFRLVAEEFLQVRMSHRTESTRVAADQRLQRNIYPWFGDRPISEITGPEILQALRLIEANGKMETAHRLRGLCSQVFRYAIATGKAERNVADDLRGALSSVQKEHRAALLDPVRFGQLLRDIDAYQGYFATKYALRLLPLVFTRPGELRLAQWTEIDFERAQWDIPAGRMKMRIPHTVPLSRQVVEILHELRALSGSSSYLFPTPRQRDKPISNVAVLNGLRRMGYGTEEQSAHGFRAIARTLLDERLHILPAYIEAQLAHRVADALGTAYNRTQHLEPRREMMQTWADYLDTLKRGEG